MRHISYARRGCSRFAMGQRRVRRARQNKRLASGHRIHPKYRAHREDCHEINDARHRGVNTGPWKGAWASHSSRNSTRSAVSPRMPAAARISLSRGAFSRARIAQRIRMRLSSVCHRDNHRRASRRAQAVMKPPHPMVSSWEEQGSYSCLGRYRRLRQRVTSPSLAAFSRCTVTALMAMVADRAA